MSDPVPIPPKPASLPTYMHPKQAAPMMKLLGKMLAKKLPRLMNNPKIHSQTIKVKHKKKKDNQVTYW